MSEFECRNGHLMPSGKTICHCGARLWKMDGKTASELRREEADDCREDDHEDEED